MRRQGSFDVPGALIGWVEIEDGVERKI